MCERTVGARTLRREGTGHTAALIRVGSLLLAPFIALAVWSGVFLSLQHFPCLTRGRIAVAITIPWAIGIKDRNRLLIGEEEYES